jgi:hypothetical protein
LEENKYDVYSESEKRIEAVGNGWGVSSPEPNPFKGDIDYS